MLPQGKTQFMSSPVVVVGAGLAGLVCARRLHRAGIPVLVLDAADRPGGRLKTDVVDGFRLDRGFQTLFTAYPAAQVELSYEALHLCRFASGALIYHDGELHDLDGDNPLKTAFDTYLSLADKLRLIEWTWECRGMSLRQVWRMPDMPTYRHLRQRGFSTDFIERFARPFLGGIFLDRSLDVSRQMFTFVWKMLSEGDTVVPEAGIEAIPRQLAADLPTASLRMNSRVKSLFGDRRVTGVTLESGETVSARAVILATEAPVAQALSGFGTPIEPRSQVCLYFAAPEPPVDQPKIVLRTGDGLVNLVVPVSEVNPAATPAGQHLVSVTLNGDHALADADLAKAVKAEVAPWFAPRVVDEWRLLAVYRLPFAQFHQPAHFRNHLPATTPGRDGLYLAGEYTEHSSIQGALASGQTCADIVVEDLTGVLA